MATAKLTPTENYERCRRDGHIFVEKLVLKTDAEWEIERLRARVAELKETNRLLQLIVDTEPKR